MTFLILILVFVLIIGLCIGSFLNVVILRALSDESIVFPASKCPKCQTPLKWWHNIPVISYIFLRGKCAFCKEPISIQYPLIELFTGIMFVIMFLKFGFSIETLYAWTVTSILIVLAGTDIKEKVVFDMHTYTLIGVGLAFAIYATIIQFSQGYNFTNITFWSNPIMNGIEGALLGVIIMEVFARLGYVFVGARAFGEGDTLIAAGLGMIFGWQNLITVLIFSVVIQVLLFLPMFIIGLVKQKQWINLTTFMAFIFYASGFYMLQKFNLINSDLLYIAGAAILAILGILSCVLIFKGLRENPADRTYLPFGPAMVAAAFIGMLL